MDGRKDTSHVADGQGALRKRYKKKDGSLAIVVELQPNVFEFGRLVLLPRRSVLDGYADALGRARAALKAGITAGDTDNALAAFEAAQDAALALLREAFEIMSALDDYLAAGMAIFPVNARGAPLTQHGVKDASSDPEVIKAWRERWPGCDFGWAVPADVVVVDLDEKHGKHGLRDFRERAGCDPHEVMTPQATTPSGGLHLVYRATKPYKNLAPAVGETGVDTRTAGGYVVLPLASNGRTWLKPLIGGDGVVAPLLSAPAWLDIALRKEPRPSLSQPRAPLILAPARRSPRRRPIHGRKGRRSASLRGLALKILDRARGAQDATRHAQCFYIGGLIGRGDLGYEEGFAAPFRGCAGDAGLCGSVAQSRDARRALDRERHRGPAAPFGDRAVGARFPRAYASAPHPNERGARPWLTNNPPRMPARAAQRQRPRARRKRNPRANRRRNPMARAPAAAILSPRSKPSGLAGGDFTLFIEIAKTDPSFPHDPDAIAVINKIGSRDRVDLIGRLKKETEVRIGAFEDALRKAKGGDGSGDDGMPGRPITFEKVEPWPDPVNGSELLTHISRAIGRYVIMDNCQRDAAALGAVFSHTHDLRDTAPIFFVVSPTKRCGKTRMERVIKRLARKPLMASSATAASLARAIEKHRPTVLIDEFDATIAGDQGMAETLRGQLNSSFDRDGANILKCVSFPGGGYDEREFSTWAATWIAGIRKIPDTIKDRSVILRLKRKLASEKVARFRGKDGGELDVLRRKITRFVADNEQRLRDIEPKMPEALNAAGDRAPDAWEPLFAIADRGGRRLAGSAFARPRWRFASRTTKMTPRAMSTSYC